MCSYLFFIPIAVLAIFAILFIVASIMDYKQARKDSKDLFKIIAKDYTDVRKPARK